MEKDKKTINKLRKEIAFKIMEAFGDTPQKGRRIAINSKDLQELLFDEINDEEKKPCLLPVWSGPFLEHIDLSAIDFSNVYWRGDKVENGIAYKNTNAKIQFDKRRPLYNCDFSGTDLSQNDLLSLNATRCNFSATNIQVNDTLKSFSNVIYNFTGCNFSGLNFRDITISLNGVVSRSCNFNQTGLHIYFKDFPILMGDESKEVCRDNFRKMLDFDMLTGCYINNVFVTEDKDQKDFLYSILFGEPEERAKKVLEDINNQIELIKKNC